MSDPEKKLYKNCERLNEVADKVRAIMGFIEEQGEEESWELIDGDARPVFHDTLHEAVLRYFEIDPDELEAERSRIIEALS